LRWAVPHDLVTDATRIPGLVCSEESLNPLAKLLALLLGQVARRLADSDVLQQPRDKIVAVRDSQVWWLEIISMDGYKDEEQDRCKLFISRRKLRLVLIMDPTV
jgi:hypothetical protein